MIVSAMGDKHPGGRPITKNRVKRTYMVDRKVAEYIDSLPDGDRSDFVSAVLAGGIRRRPAKRIEIRLTPDQSDLQDQINEKIEDVQHLHNRDLHSKDIILSVPFDVDTAFLDSLGVQYTK